MKVARFAFFGFMMMAAVCRGQDTTAAPQPVETDPQRAVSKEDVLKIISEFRKDPHGAMEKGRGALILAFAEQSKEVQISINGNVLSWSKDDIDPAIGSVLLTAYIAGEIQAQLSAHLAKDDPMAGALQVIDTYQQMKKADSKLRVPSVEQWITLQAQGKLRAALETK